MARGSNPRFIIISLKGEGKDLYENIYCQREEAENRIKEQQLYLFADRLSCSKMKENQLRFWFSTLAYNLMHLFRIKALKGTRMAKAQCHTIRENLIKIGGMIKVSCRRIYISLSEGFVWKELFIRARLTLVPDRKSVYNFAGADFVASEAIRRSAEDEGNLDKLSRSSTKLGSKKCPAKSKDFCGRALGCDTFRLPIPNDLNLCCYIHLSLSVSYIENYIGCNDREC